METDILQKKFDRLLDLTRRVRGHQIEYFKYRAKSDMEKARYWERQLDQFIKAEIADKAKKQGDLFK